MAETLVKKNADINDTVRLISERISVDSHSPFIKALVSRLNTDPSNVPLFLARLQDFVYRNVNYKLDPKGRERVLRPETTLNNGEGDCKKMTVIIASALKAAGIPALLKHVFFKDQDFTHIYVIVPKDAGSAGRPYYTLDPVENSTFDKETRYDWANIYNLNGTKQMDLYTGAVPKNGKLTLVQPLFTGSNQITNDLNAIGKGQIGSAADAALIELMMSEPETMSGIGRRSRDERKRDREKLKNALKKGGLLPVRGAFLGLVAINALKLATRLLKAYGRDQNKVKKFWEGAGGDWEKLKGAIANGSKQRVAGGPNTHAFNNSGSIGVAVAAGAAAAIATALPLIDQALRIFKDLGVSEGAEADRELDEGIELGEETGAQPNFNPVASVNTFLNQNAQSMPNVNVPRMPSPTAGGDSLAISWKDPYQIFYAVFRAGFYSAVASQICSNIF